MQNRKVSFSHLPTMADSTKFCEEQTTGYRDAFPTPQSVVLKLAHRFLVTISRLALTNFSKQTDVINFIPSHAYYTHTFSLSSDFLTMQCTVYMYGAKQTQNSQNLSPCSNRETTRRVEPFDNKHFLIRRMPSCYSVQRCQHQQTNFPN